MQCRNHPSVAHRKSLVRIFKRRPTTKQRNKMSDRRRYLFLPAFNFIAATRLVKDRDHSLVFLSKHQPIVPNPRQAVEIETGLAAEHSNPWDAAV